MLINRLLWYILFLIVCLAISCHENDLDYSLIHENIHTEIESFESDSILIINITFNNNNSKDFAIPISQWVVYQHEHGGGMLEIDSNYIGTRNTLTYYDDYDSLLGGVFEIRSFPENNYSPCFIVLNSKSNTNFTLKLSKFKINKNYKYYSIFKKDVNYTFQIKLGLIEYVELENILNSRLSDNSLILDTNLIEILESKFGKLIFDVCESNVPINKRQLEKLNSLSNNKLILYFNHEF